MESKLNNPEGMMPKVDIGKLQRIEDSMFRLKYKIVQDMELRTELEVLIAQEKVMEKFAFFINQRNQLSEQITKNVKEYESLDLSRGAMEQYYSIK